ncbi:MAG: hypothetical protein ACPGSC_01905, partial [Granulosicoccaceae bacterium]
FSSRIMSTGTAEKLAKEFLSKFYGRTQYFTNGDFGLTKKGGEFDAMWRPATEATFDTGVIAIGMVNIGCAWFADED